MTPDQLQADAYIGSLRVIVQGLAAKATYAQRGWAAEAGLTVLQDAAGMVDPDSWWTVDHYDSDRHYHAYCGRCLNQISDWLIRYQSQIPDPAAYDDGDGYCDGCKKDMPSRPV